MAASPSTQNYRIGTGIVSFQKDGDVGFRDLGNVPSFVYTPTVTTVEHKSSRGGTKSTDVTRVTEVSAVVKFDLEEVTAENMAYFMLADVNTDSDGDLVLNGLTNTQITGTLKFAGDNDVGQKVAWEGSVQFVPSGDFNFLEDGDNYTKIGVEAKVLKGANGEFGKTTFPAAGL